MWCCSRHAAAARNEERVENPLSDTSPPHDVVLESPNPTPAEPQQPPRKEPENASNTGGASSSRPRVVSAASPLGQQDFFDEALLMSVPPRTSTILRLLGTFVSDMKSFRDRLDATTVAALMRGDARHKRPLKEVFCVLFMQFESNAACV